MSAIEADETPSRRHRLDDVRNALVRAGIDGLILPVTDEYQGEYSADYARRVTWLSGFDGSAGTLLIGAEFALLLTDGRYTLQATAETDYADYEVANSTEVTLSAAIRGRFDKGANIGYDPWLHTVRQAESLEKALAGSGIVLTPLAENPVDTVWPDRPQRPAGLIVPYLIQHAGLSQLDKCAAMAAMLRKAGVASFYLSKPEDVCWLLNVRGSDVPYNPLPLVTALLHDDGAVELFAEAARFDAAVKKHLGHDVRIFEPAELGKRLARAAEGGLAIDPASTPQAVIALAGLPMQSIDNPVTLAKAVKNAAEIEGIREAHRTDGRAVRRFLDWYRQLPDDAAPSEIEIGETLEAFRNQMPDYRGPSFATIAGSGPNGAIVHYRANETTARNVAKDDVLLLDSGAQYLSGTTDVTRTLCRGEPGQEFRERYAFVLKGHIALATARFPEGTTGSQLDILARQYLWAAGLDYEHGTGHGVGCFLSVHEGPQRIAKKGGDVALVPGMILSNEPGYYKAGEYGIRIENLVLVVEKETGPDGKRFLGFETLTRVPIDVSLADPKWLTEGEMAWLAHYHAGLDD